MIDIDAFERRGLFQFNTSITQYKMRYPSVEDWLISIGYEDYLEDFESAGYNNLEYMILQTVYPTFRLDECLLRNQMGLSNEKIIKDIMKNLE